MIKKFFQTGADKPLIDAAPEKIRAIYKKSQWQVFAGLVFGYAMFYVVRTVLSIAKKPMLDAGVVSMEELGLIGSAFYFTYAFGKFSNGFLADYAHIGRFMSVSLFLSSLACMGMGMGVGSLFFMILWAVNGWCQSVGSAPSCVSIFQWYSPKQRGSVYAIWGGSRNIGEAISMILTASLVSYFGWEVGFVGAGIAGIAAAICMLILLKDRPRTYGLPDPAVAYGEETAESAKAHDPAAVKKAQIFVLKQPVVWMIALACAAMYSSRYALSSWALMFMQSEKGYSLIDSSTAMSVYPIAGFFGAILSGIISDKVFNANRHIPTFLYGIANVIGMALLFWGPNNHTMDAFSLGLIGFSVGGLVVFLAGLNACDLMPKTAVGAVKGFIGLFSYLAASLQEIVSSKLITVTEVAGVKHYDFSTAQYFWIGTAILSVFLAASVWNCKKVEMPE